MDRIMSMTDTEEQGRRMLPVGLAAYFVRAMWLLWEPDRGEERRMAKLVDASYPAPSLGRKCPAGEFLARPDGTMRVRAACGGSPRTFLAVALHRPG